MREKSKNIEAIRKQFRRKREWLLIAVDKAKGATPLTGRLIAHSPHQDDIFKKSISSKIKDLLIDYSEDAPPKGTAIIFPVYKTNA